MLYELRTSKKISKKTINNQTVREALNLSKKFPKSDSQQELTLKNLRDFQWDDWVKCTEDPSVPLEKKLALSILVNAFHKDERIQTLRPHMISIPGGTFQMGLSSKFVSSVVLKYKKVGVKREWIEKETPAFQTHVDPFCLARYPVTNYEYYCFLKECPNKEIPSSWAYCRYPKERANHPVYTISRNSAQNYCSWLSKKTQKHYRLPTEKEWEFAAGGGKQFEFPWGNRFRASNCNTLESRLLTTTPVGIYPQGNSPFGISDMAGNVEEYVSGNYFPYPGGKIIRDDLFKVTGSVNYPMTRGGSFARSSDLARIRRRHGFYPKEIYVIGFRLACSSLEAGEEWLERRKQ